MQVVAVLSRCEPAD